VGESEAVSCISTKKKGALTRSGGDVYQFLSLDKTDEERGRAEKSWKWEGFLVRGDLGREISTGEERLECDRQNFTLSSGRKKQKKNKKQNPTNKKKGEKKKNTKKKKKKKKNKKTKTKKKQKKQTH